MTEPGYVAPPQPGWWVRKDRIGTAATEVEWDTHIVGESPIIRYRPKMRPANPKVGPMALRYRNPRKPQSLRTRVQPLFFTVGQQSQQLIANNGSLAWFQSVPSASCVLVALTVFTTAYNTVTITVTVDGQAATLLGSVIDYNDNGTAHANTYVYGLLNAPTGMPAVNVAFNSPSGNYQTTIYGFTYSGVSGFGTVTTKTAASGAPTMSAVSTSGELMFNSYGQFTSTPTAYNRTERANNAWSSGVGLAMVAGDTGGLPTTTFTTSNSTAYGGIIVPLLPIK